MEFLVDKMGDATILTIPEETLEMSNVDEFKRDIIPHLESSTRIVFDMSGLQFIDSSGCGALTFCLRKIREKNDGSSMNLCGVSKQIDATFRLIRLNRLVDIYETREEAVASHSK